LVIEESKKMPEKKEILATVNPTEGNLFVARKYPKIPGIVKWNHSHKIKEIGSFVTNIWNGVYQGRKQKHNVLMLSLSMMFRQ